MNISIATVGSRGDVQPYIALGQGLQRRGHRVQIVTDGLSEGLIRGAGVDFASIAADPLEVLRSGDVTKVGHNPWRLIQWIDRHARPLARRYFGDLRRACQDADLVLFSVLALPAPHVAEALGIPALAAYLQPVSPTRAFPNPAAGQPLAKLPLAGTRRLVRGEVIEDPPAVAAGLRRFFEDHPNLARYFGVALGPDGCPDASRLEKLAQERVIIYLHPRDEA